MKYSVIPNMIPITEDFGANKAGCRRPKDLYEIPPPSGMPEGKLSIKLCPKLLALQRAGVLNQLHSEEQQRNICIR